MKLIATCAALVAGSAMAGAEAPVDIWPEGKMPSAQTNQTYIGRQLHGLRRGRIRGGADARLHALRQTTHRQN